MSSTSEEQHFQHSFTTDILQVKVLRAQFRSVLEFVTGGVHTDLPLSESAKIP